LLDLRQFSRINAVFGYALGDQVLAAVGARLTAAGFGNAIIARVGNDEFALALRDLRDPLFITLAANKVVRVMAEPFVFGEHTLRLPVNVGMDVAQTPNAEAERLFKFAEISLRHARESGVTLIPYGEDAALAEHDWQFESELVKAVEEQTLTLFYQPKIDLATGLPTMAEALGRWEHPTRGLISPAMFVPL
jgi:diguanylate cyclase (GGDEF)-like protein